MIADNKPNQSLFFSINSPFSFRLREKNYWTLLVLPSQSAMFFLLDFYHMQSENNTRIRNLVK